MLSPAITYTTSAVRSLLLPVTVETGSSTEAGFSSAEDFQPASPLPKKFRHDIHYIGRDQPVRKPPVPAQTTESAVHPSQHRTFEQSLLTFLQTRGKIIGDYLLLGGEMYHYAKPIPPDAVKTTLAPPNSRHNIIIFGPASNEKQLDALIKEWTGTMQNAAAREAMMRHQGYITPEEAEKRLTWLMTEAIYGPSLAVLDRCTVFGMVPEAALLQELQTLLGEHLPLFFNQFEPDARNYLWKKLKSHFGVQEVWQEFCLRCCTKWNTYRGEGPVRHWFFRILQRCVMKYSNNERRRNSRYVMGVEHFLEVGSSSEWDFPFLGDSELEAKKLQQLRKALRRLKPDFQDIILLVVYGERPLPAAARTLGITHTAARSRLHRARRALKEEMKKSDT